jgi:hypothetical protein
MAMAKSDERKSEERVTSDDIRSKLREIEGSLQATTEEVAPIGKAIAVAAVVAVIVLAYAFGRRRGRKRSTFVEIRRI